MVVRFPMTVHGAGGDLAFVVMLVRIAREKGVSAYIGQAVVSRKTVRPAQPAEARGGRPFPVPGNRGP